MELDRAPKVWGTRCRTAARQRRDRRHSGGRCSVFEDERSGNDAIGTSLCDQWCGMAPDAAVDDDERSSPGPGGHEFADAPRRSGIELASLHSDLRAEQEDSVDEGKMLDG